jgi:hypothetical protein
MRPISCLGPPCLRAAQRHSFPNVVQSVLLRSIINMKNLDKPLAWPVKSLIKRTVRSCPFGCISFGQTIVRFSRWISLRSNSFDPP